MRIPERLVSSLSENAQEILAYLINVNGTGATKDACRRKIEQDPAGPLEELLDREYILEDGNRYRVNPEYTFELVAKVKE